MSPARLVLRPPSCHLLPGGSCHMCLSVCPPPEMIYRHVTVIDGEMVHFEILDTAGQVSSGAVVRE